MQTSYAIWAGVGTALTACMGIIFFGEGVGLLKVVALLLIIVGVVVLNKSNDDSKEEKYEIQIVD